MGSSGASPGAGPVPPAEQRARQQGYLALVAVQFCFGLMPVFGKWAILDFAPRVIVGWRIVGGAFALALVAFAVHGRRAWPARGTWPRFLACSLLGVAVNMLLFLEGLARSTATNAGLLTSLIPVFTFAIAVLLRQERFVAQRGLGILVALAGSLVLALEERPELGGEYVLGNLLMMVNCCCYSFYLVLARPLLARHPPLVVIAWVFALSALGVPLFAGSATWVPPGAAARSWASMAYILVFPTVVAYLLNAFALARVSASTTAVFVFSQALITGVAAALLLHEPLRPRTLLAAVLILGGTALVLPRHVARPLPATT
jgi:drug/metabolite transporter (DMT)-like permease